jgi:PncC family amidohydrolase
MSVKNIVEGLHKKFSKYNKTLAVAESCTGGLIASSITELPGVSNFFLGGVVSYANQAKHDLLGVSQKLLRTKGAVSKEVVKQMAQGAKKVFHSDWAVSVSGVAGPAGGTKFKPVGLVVFAVVGPNFVKVAKKNFKGSRKEIQRAAANEALKLLQKSLKNS